MFEFALDESAVHEDGLAAVIGMEGDDEVVAQLGFAGPGLDQDFIGVVEPAPELYLSILKLWNDMWTNSSVEERARGICTLLFFYFFKKSVNMLDST